MMKKNEAKLTNLKKKFRSNEEEKLDRIPEAIKDLPLDNLSIFDKQKYENIEVIEYEAEVIGEVELSNNERLILRLPPKFAIEENLPLEGLALDEELASAKERMTIHKEEEEKLDIDDEGIGEEEEDEEAQEEMDKFEAESRQIYDPKTRTFNDRKRRVTDLLTIE